MTTTAPTATPFDVVLIEIKSLAERLDRIEKRLSLNVAKDAYTVEEAAERFGNAVFTVRQWANRGCIRATKTRGTGKRGTWRISAEELARVQEHGPSPERTFDNQAAGYRGCYRSVTGSSRPVAESSLN